MNSFPLINIVLLGGSSPIGREFFKVVATHTQGNIRINALTDDPGELPEYPFITAVLGELPQVPEKLFPEKPFILINFGNDSDKESKRRVKLENVSGTQALMGALPEHVMGVLYGSSMSVYGSGALDDIHESVPVNPQTPVAESLAKAEKIVLDKMKDMKKCAFILRPHLILNADDESSSLRGILKLAQRGLNLNQGKSQFSVISVGDYAQIIFRLILQIFKRDEMDAPVQRALNVGYREALSLQRMLAVICEIYELSIPENNISLPAWSIETLKMIPIPQIGRLLSHVESLGFSKNGNISTLEAEIGSDLLDQSAENILRQVIVEMKQTILENEELPLEEEDND
ncbi:MAG: NAD-dependent epimerase/dehydratase family protein [SAR324 cluster bacterium]|nr:NAD-dependent epimerase/dehydratase family protein [SAR324 cluster bacterium]